MKSKSVRSRRSKTLSVADLFAGVGGFRLGLEAADRFKFIWSNQWEPGGRSKQFASRCYISHYGDGASHHNTDLALLVRDLESGVLHLPAPDVVVGGFPCQDYSVAKAKNQSLGLQGRKGVLWWEIYKLLSFYLKRGELPRALLLENVDRLLSSPSKRRGRDFAIMLRSLTLLGYQVEWRVVNAADYGFPQRRRRVFIVALLGAPESTSPVELLLHHGVLAQSLPCSARLDPRHAALTFKIDGTLDELSDGFPSVGMSKTPFMNAGVAIGGAVTTLGVTPRFKGKGRTLESVLVKDERVPASFYLREDQMELWRALKGSKRIVRSHRTSGEKYIFAEGNVEFPDPVNRPARTILTSEGGSYPSRTRHVVETARGLRRLIPEELEALNGFPKGWTAGCMTPSQRAYCMGNALVVGVVRRIAPFLHAAVGELGG